MDITFRDLTGSLIGCKPVGGFPDVLCLFGWVCLFYWGLRRPWAHFLRMVLMAVMGNVPGYCFTA